MEMSDLLEISKTEMIAIISDALTTAEEEVNAKNLALKQVHGCA